MAKGPAGMGQKVFALESIAGSGDGGRKFWHRYELFDHAFSVRTDVVVNKVAGEKDWETKCVLQLNHSPRLELVFVRPSISSGLSPRTVRLR